MRRAAGFSAVALSASSLGAVLAACSSTTSDEPSVTTGPVGTPTAGGTLKAALTGEPDTIDPATSTIYTGAQVYDNIFNKLIDLDPSNEFYGQLATAWNAPDDQTWVFDLVDRRTFHNGEKFGPDDVAYTFERILDPKTASSYAPLYDAISKVEATGADAGDVPSEDTVRSVPVEPREQRRDREPEGDRVIGPVAQRDRDRPVRVRRMGARRPRHAEEERQLLHRGQALPGRDRIPVPERGPEPRRRAAVG